MAGEPGYTATFYIYPSTATFTATAVDNRGNSLGTYSSSTLPTTTRNGQSCYYIFFESDDGVVLTVNAYGQTYTSYSAYGAHEFDVTITYISDPIPAPGPESLYAYTDQSQSSTSSNLYAWYNSLYDCTFWTNTTTPDIYTNIYNAYGHDITQQYCPGYPGDGFSSASEERLIYRMPTSGVHYLPSEHVLFNGTSGTANFNRDSSKDIIVDIGATLYTGTTMLNENTSLYNNSGITLDNMLAIDTISIDGISFTVKTYYINYNPTGVDRIIYEDYQNHYYSMVNGVWTDITANVTVKHGLYIVWSPFVMGSNLSSTPKWSYYWGRANSSDWGITTNSGAFSGYPYLIADTYFKSLPPPGITAYSTYKKVSSGESTGSYTYSYIYTGHTEYPSGTNQRYWYLYPWITYADPSAKMLYWGNLYYAPCYRVKSVNDKKYAAFVGNDTGTIYYYNTKVIRGYNGGTATNSVSQGDAFYYVSGYTGRVSMFFNSNGNVYVLRNPDLNGFTGTSSTITREYYTYETATRDVSKDRDPVYYAWTGTSTSDRWVYTSSKTPVGGDNVYGSNNWIGMVTTFDGTNLVFTNSAGSSCSFVRTPTEDCLSLTDAYFNTAS